MEKKITKREMFEAIKVGCTTGEWTVSDVEVAEFCDNEIALLDKKAAKAKERQAAKKAEGDELTDIVKSVMSTDEFEVIADIAAKVAEIDAESTIHKVTYRLGQLVKNGLAESTDVKIPASEGAKARTIKGYKLIG